MSKISFTMDKDNKPILTLNWQDFIKWCEEHDLKPNEGKNLRRFVKEEGEGK